LLPAASFAVADRRTDTFLLRLTALRTADSEDFGSAIFTVLDLPAFSLIVLMALRAFDFLPGGLTELESLTVQSSSHFSLTA